MSNLTKIALVTGASRGIGAEVAKRLAKDGFAVVINYAGNKQAAENVVNEIKLSGGTAQAFQANVSDASAVTNLFDFIESSMGSVNVLVNNAGIMELKAIADSNEQHVDQLIDVNLKGTINTLREASNRLKFGGKIINFSTSVVGLKLENYGVYAATKAAVETLTGILAKEMRGKQITVNAIAPGPTATELFLKGKSDELIARMANMNPLERLGTPADIASVVSFLASADSHWVNGQILRANGGVV
ncbi:SDR family oxidoreductase [Alteromonas sp. 14N.309.X.WAT.G.H12]|uniref:SDR family oxidoreductase n=1 Tax=Alteromonas sp. 14N.309.X.WAT.G.H12 TaxID=3120824 RepID=UPI002FCFA243